METVKRSEIPRGEGDKRMTKNTGFPWQLKYSVQQSTYIQIHARKIPSLKKETPKRSTGNNTWHSYMNRISVYSYHLD